MALDRGEREGSANLSGLQGTGNDRPLGHLLHLEEDTEQWFVQCGSVSEVVAVLLSHMSHKSHMLHQHVEAAPAASTCEPL